MLVFGCFCCFSIGSAAGFAGIALHMPGSYYSPPAGVTLFWAAAAFLMIGCVFAAVLAFIKDNRVSTQHKTKILEHLVGKLPDVGKLLQLLRQVKPQGKSDGNDSQGDDGHA